MATTQQELESFAEFAQRQLASGSESPSIDELFDEWRVRNPPAGDAKAIQASLRDMENGETGREFGEFSDEFRKRNGITE